MKSEKKIRERFKKTLYIATAALDKFKNIKEAYFAGYFAALRWVLDEHKKN